MQRFLLTASALCASLPSLSLAAQEVQFNHLQTITTMEAEAEIVVFDQASGRLFVTDANSDQLDIYQTSSTPGSALTLFASVDLAGSPNSVAVKNGLVAVAVEAPVKQDPGSVLFFDLDGNPSGASVVVGAVPDMLVYTPDGSKLVVANEGEADQATGLVNPEGSVSIVDVVSRTASTASFAPLNANKAALQAVGVRLSDTNGITLAQDVEPEYVAISPDGLTAYVTVQEANSVAVIDVLTATVLELRPLGEKDHSLIENQFDASNQDAGDGVFITANVLGLYMPDAIAAFEVGGQLYYATANEGDSRADFAGFNDEERGKDLASVLPMDLDIETAVPNTSLYSLSDLNDNAVLGRLKFATSDYDLARGDTDGDGDVDQLYSFGGRSVTIWDATTGALVFDSGDDFEQLMLAEGLFDDSRSDDKGPEPESVTTGVINGTPLLFVGLERTSAVLAYDVSNPASPIYLGLINLLLNGAEAPEGLAFIPANESATGLPTLAVASEASGSVSLYELVLSDLGNSYCFGDGTATPCPCANGTSGEGCANSTGVGAVLTANGSNSLAADDLTLVVSQTPVPSFGVFFAGSNQVASGAGQPFGNGLLCTSGQIKRLQTLATGLGAAATTISIATVDSAQVGETRHFQFWYRDTADLGCAGDFNTSNALSLTWQL